MVRGDISILNNNLREFVKLPSSWPPARVEGRFGPAVVAPFPADPLDPADPADPVESSSRLVLLLFTMFFAHFGGK